MHRHRSAEPVVDVDHDYAARARGEHREHGGETRQVGAIADAGGYGDHRACDQPADDTRKRPFHSGHHDDCVGLEQVVAIGEDPVNASDPDVEETQGAQPGHAEGFRCLFGDWNVAGPSRDDGDLLGARIDLGDLERCDPCELGNLQGWQASSDFFGLGGIDAGDEHVVAPTCDLSGDDRDLVSCLRLAEDDLRLTLSQGAMVIDPCEPKIGEREVTNAFDGGVDVSRSRTNAFEQLAQGSLVHVCASSAVAAARRGVWNHIRRLGNCPSCG